jgi:anthranilate phosphoribosyltransferase
MIREAIDAIVNEGRSLSEQEASSVMGEIMSGEATPAQLGAFLVALRLKGETAEEIAGMARVMRAKALRVPFEGQPLLDTCGTGGDGMGTFNVSTAAAFVAAGAGAVVAKHGNRAMTSHCGSADVLEALGVKIDLPPEGVAHCLREVGIGFMFAPSFHPAMRFAAGPRREIGVRSVFNILGPLTNPAGARSQVLGVADAAIGEKMIQVLARLGCRHALVVHGEDGLDEMSLSGPTLVYELEEGDIRSYRVMPEEVGLRQASGKAVKGGSPEENAAAMRAVFSGEQGALRDIVLLNSAAALVAADKAGSLTEGVTLAAQTIDSGAAGGKLNHFIKETTSFG